MGQAKVKEAEKQSAEQAKAILDMDRNIRQRKFKEAIDAASDNYRMALVPVLVFRGTSMSASIDIVPKD